MRQAAHHIVVRLVRPPHRTPVVQSNARSADASTRPHSLHHGLPTSQHRGLLSERALPIRRHSKLTADARPPHALRVSLQAWQACMSTREATEWRASRLCEARCAEPHWLTSIIQGVTQRSSPIPGPPLSARKGDEWSRAGSVDDGSMERNSGSVAVLDSEMAQRSEE